MLVRLSSTFCISLVGAVVKNRKRCTISNCYSYRRPASTSVKMGSAVTAKPTNLAEGEGYQSPLPLQLDLGLVQTKTVGELIPTEELSLTVKPKLFTPIQIRGLQLHNRIIVSPMCMYSCAKQNGVFSDFHLIHYGSFALRGPGLVFTEATAVTPEGRLSPEDTGLWNDLQKESLKRVVDVVHVSGSKLGVQLAHGGRKAATYPPFHNYEQSKGQLGRGLVPPEEGGFADQIIAPSPTPWKGNYVTPRELSTGEVKEMVKDWANAAKKAADAGVDLIEIHAAHGYLIHEFLSGNTNKRTDEYGGNLQNRLRFLLEIVTAIRAVIPADMPLFCRVSGTDFAHDPNPLAADPNGWDIYQVTEFCRQAVQLGLDLIDISASGNLPTAKGAMFATEFGFQLPLAEAVKGAHIEGLLVGGVGMLGNGKKAEQALVDEKADVVFIARQFLDDPNLVYTMAKELGIPGLKPRRALQYSWMWPWTK